MELIDVIFCEDIRFEQNNKLSLMGVYSDRIIFHFDKNTDVKWPVATKLSTLLRFKINKLETHPDRFIFEYIMNNNKLASMNGMIKIDNNQSTANLALLAPQLPLEIGNLGFSIQLLNEDISLFSYKNITAIEIAKE